MVRVRVADSPAAASLISRIVGFACRREPLPPPSMTERPTLTVAVLIERLKAPTQWEDWRHRVAEVVLDEGGYGRDARLLRDDGHETRTLHPGLDVTLHIDEAEGYYLNLTSGSPSWFVWWRIDDTDPSRSWPEFVTLSYNEAGRLLEAEERVDSLPVPAAVRDWLTRLDGAPPQDGMTERQLRPWRRKAKEFVTFAVLRHPLARA